MRLSGVAKQGYTMLYGKFQIKGTSSVERRKKMLRYIYSLRFAVEPGFREAEKIDNLLAFCEQGQVDDVMFFINCEEINKGHLTLEETKPWIERISTWKERLQNIGVTTSLNPWPTLLHCDRGRKLRGNQRFNLMVDPYGKKATAVVCPLCPQWRQYITEMYAFYATVKPWILWVEDDFRLHNHPPLEWGGCFCQLHVEEYSKRAGKQLTRNKFVEGVLRPGAPHPYRKVWLETSRQAMVSLAQLIGNAVHSVSPDTKIGLMSSHPSVHCAEGRDWQGIHAGLSGNTPPVNRVLLPAYQESTPQAYFWHFNTGSRMVRTFVPASTEIYPELENFPFGPYSKSNKFITFQLESAAALRPLGMTLNIFDMMGNGVREQDSYQVLLSRNKNFLTSLTGLDFGLGHQKGVKVLANPDSSFTLHTESGKSIDELYPQEGFWAAFLSAFGIANNYSMDSAHSKQVVAISGQYLRNLEQAQIEHLFAENFVLLEGESAYTLFDMGLGRLAGIKCVRWHPAQQFYASYEQVTNGLVYYNLPEARLSAQYDSGDYLEVEYTGNASPISTMKNYEGQSVGPGMSVYNQKVFLFPYGHFKGQNSSHVNSIVKEIILGVIMGIKEFEQPWYVKAAPYVSLFAYHMNDRILLLLMNAGNDDQEKLELWIPQIEPKDIVEVSRECPAGSRIVYEQKDSSIVVTNGIGGMEIKVLIIRI